MGGSATNFRRPTTPNLKGELNRQLADSKLTIHTNRKKRNLEEKTCTIKQPGKMEQFNK